MVHQFICLYMHNEAKAKNGNNIYQLRSKLDDSPIQLIDSAFPFGTLTMKWCWEKGDERFFFQRGDPGKTKKTNKP